MYFPYKRIAAQGPSGAAAQRFSFAGGRLQICCPVISSPVIAVILLVIAIAANFIVARQFKGTPESAPMSGCWTEGSEPAQALRDYVAKVTDPSDKENFIPEEEEEELAPAA